MHVVHRYKCRQSSHTQGKTSQTKKPPKHIRCIFFFLKKWTHCGVAVTKQHGAGIDADMSAGGAVPKVDTCLKDRFLQFQSHVCYCSYQHALSGLLTVFYSSLPLLAVSVWPYSLASKHFHSLPGTGTGTGILCNPRAWDVGSGGSRLCLQDWRQRKIKRDKEMFHISSYLPYCPSKV